MEIMIREAGNSLVATIPKPIIEELGIKKGDTFNVTSENGNIIFKTQKKKLKGEIFLEELYGMPYEQIPKWERGEFVDTGKPVGDEEW